MSLLRALLLPMISCAVLLAGCQQGSDESASSAKRTPPSAACPSRTDIAAAISKHDESKGVIIPDQVICDGEWATAPMSYPGLDPARAVVRLQNGQMSVVAAGTDRLCDLPEMKQAPEKIRKALGEFC